MYQLENNIDDTKLEDLSSHVVIPSGQISSRFVIKCKGKYLLHKVHFRQTPGVLTEYNAG